MPAPRASLEGETHEAAWSEGHGWHKGKERDAGTCASPRDQKCCKRKDANFQHPPPATRQERPCGSSSPQSCSCVRLFWNIATENSAQRPDPIASGP